MPRKCGQCDLNINRSSKTIDCNAYNKPYHENCCDLDENEFKIVSNKKSSLKWFCKLCDSHVNDLLTNYEKFKKVNLAIENIRDELRTEMNKKIENLDERLRKFETGEVNQNITSTIKKVVNQTYRWLLTRKICSSKRRNVI